MNNINKLQVQEELDQASTNNITVPSVPVAKQKQEGLVVKPRGRPPGSKNKETLFKEMMSDKFQVKATTEVSKVLDVLFKKAQGGDMKAIKMVLDRIVPTTRSVDLEQMEKGGLSINISVGSLEQLHKEDIEDADYTEV